jgi:adenylate kinase
MPSYIVLLGPPGAGKGTQAQLISSKLGLPHVSSGDLFREHLKAETELGRWKYYMDRGELVPDDVTIEMVRQRLSKPDCAAGALLDGFPRTPPQAEALATMLEEFNGKVDAVPYINVPEDVLVERLSGRWTCRAEGHVFHEKYNPPQEAGRCGIDGSGIPTRRR